MIKMTMRLAVPLALAAATTVAADRPAAATSPTVAGISGWARMDYPLPDDDIRIFVDAHGLFTPHDQAVPARSWGTFRIQHLMPQTDGKPPLFNWGNFKVDCVRVDGPDVAVTGRIFDAGPFWQEFLHRERPARMGLSFHVPAPGGGVTRIGITPPTADGQPELPKCSTKAPNADAIEGGYTVMDTRRY